KADVQHTRLPALQRRLSRPHREYIEGIARPVTGRHCHELIQVTLALGERLAFERFPTRMDGQTALARSEDEREYVPGADGLNPAAQTRSAVEVFQHGQVRIVLLGVRVDARIAETAENLVVAGIGELQAIRAADAGFA